MQMTSDFARDFNNEVHDNPPEENVRDTSDEKDSLLSSLHPEIVITYACHLSPKFLSVSVCLSLSLSLPKSFYTNLSNHRQI